ncbi:hypothetical protein P7D46_01940 [Enterococcus dongliensis]|nr:hypothetical protein [Enterococcus dongliensis]
MKDKIALLTMEKRSSMPFSIPIQKAHPKMDVLGDNDFQFL